MKILFLSDLHHLNNYPHTDSGYGRVFNDFPNVLETLSTVIEENSFDLLILGGDLTEHGEKEDYQAIKKRIEDYPYLITLGNHDHKEAFYEVFHGKSKNDPYHHVHLQGNYCFIVFDSSKEGFSEGYYEEDDLIWLKKQIEKHADYEIIVITHHHLLSFQHDTLALDGAKKLVSILQAASIKLVLTGHTHTPFYYLSEQTHYLTTGSLAYRAHREGSKLFFKDECYYTVIELDDELCFEFKQVKTSKCIFSSFDLEKETL